MNAKELLALGIRIGMALFSGILLLLLAIIAWQGRQVIARQEHQAEAIIAIDKRMIVVESTRWTPAMEIESRNALSHELQLRLGPVTEDVAEIKAAIAKLSREGHYDRN